MSVVGVLGGRGRSRAARGQTVRAAQNLLSTPITSRSRPCAERLAASHPELQQVKRQDEMLPASRFDRQPYRFGVCKVAVASWGETIHNSVYLSDATATIPAATDTTVRTFDLSRWDDTGPELTQLNNVTWFLSDKSIHLLPNVKHLSNGHLYHHVTTRPMTCRLLHVPSYPRTL